MRATPVRHAVLAAWLILNLSYSLRAQEAAPQSQPVFPFESTIRDFDNGLRLITIPAEYPGTVAIHCVVSVGSRNEVEVGRSGFAHFFEHMMFRGTENMSAAEQAAEFQAAGASRNAYTTDDYTNYHTVVPTEELERVLRLEADRFQHLAYSEQAFRTEALAVLGEYNKNSANPINQIFERVRAKAFDEHTYSHTTMGFLRDIRAMPGGFDYSRDFFDRYYRPEYTTIVVVGDVRPAQVEEIVEEHWSGWKRGSFRADIPAEPQQTEPREVSIRWPVPTKPWVVVAFKGPAFSTERSDMAALDLLSQLAFGENSELYQRLYVKERKVDSLFPYFPDATDPGLVYVMARVNAPRDWAAVRDAIVLECKRVREQEFPVAELQRVQQNQRYSFASQLDSSAAIADAIAGYIARARTPEAVNSVYAMYDRLTPADLLRAAGKTFVTNHRTIATLSHEPLPEAADAPALEDPFPGVLLPSASALVSVRLVFETGAVDDPVGKEGLASIASSLLTDGATSKRSYEQVTQAFFPMASSITAQVDEETIVFGGSVHRDHLDEWYGLLIESLSMNAFAEADLDRIKSDTISAIEIGLRDSDDEELGKEVLLSEIYRGHPYESLNMGTVAGVKSITVEDVRSYVQQHLFHSPVVIGLAGGYPAGFERRVLDDISRFAGADPTGGEARVFGDRFPSRAAPPTQPERNRMTIVEKQALATGMHFGFPIEVTRDHPDWVALWLVRSWLGEHRSEISHLYQRLRELRGLNYGDYAYIEYFPNGGGLTQPPPNHPRNHPAFSVWLRPVPHENAAFALKGAWYELNKLVENGLTEGEFEAARAYLTKAAPLLVQTDDRRLGYELDQAYHGVGPWVKHVRDGLETLTVGKVNEVIRRHLRTDRLQYVVVTNDGEAFRDAITGSAKTPITYATKPDQATLDEDAIIEALDLGLRPQDVKIVPANELFTGK